MEILAVLALGVVLFLFGGLFKKRSRGLFKKRSRGLFKKRSRGLSKKRPRSTITGKAYVTDGDGIRVSGYTIRLAGLDAPEWDQWAKHQDGYWFKHGKRVKSALIQAIGGKHVRVTVEGYDNHGRVLGTVTYDGKDVGAWLVQNGHAIAAYGDQYKHIEREARKARRGMWGHAVAPDPRAWRHRETRNN